MEVNYVDSFGLSPLHYAARNGHFEALKLLLNNWANPDIQNAVHVTPIFLAAQQDHVDCVRLLVLMGADVNKQCFTTCTPREFAPLGSETRRIIELALEGDMPKARELFHVDDEPIVPAFAIPHLEQAEKGAGDGSSRNRGGVAVKSAPKR